MQGNVTEVIAHLKGFVPEIARREHIRIARERLGKVLAKSPDVPYRILVDGQASTTENSVRPFGVIKYTFIRMSQVALFALNKAAELSPVQSGRYKKSWILIVDNSYYYNANGLPPNAKKIILVNFQPYARKIHLRGARLRSVPPGIVEKVRQLTFNKFKSQVKIGFEYIELKNAYKLKQNYVQTMAKHGRDRLHTRAGREITYPALVITPRD